MLVWTARHAAAPPHSRETPRTVRAPWRETPSPCEAYIYVNGPILSKWNTLKFRKRSGECQVGREHSVILTSHRGPLYNWQESVTSSCHTRSHPWERLRLSRSRRCVQGNNGTPYASSSMHALTSGSIPSNSS